MRARWCGAGTEDQPCSGPGKSLEGSTPGTTAAWALSRLQLSDADTAGPPLSGVHHVAHGGGSGAPTGPAPHLLVILSSASP